MPCLMNCDTCYFKKINQGKSGWCYMFREEPEGECRQHSGFKTDTAQIIKYFKEGKNDR